MDVTKNSIPLKPEIAAFRKEPLRLGDVCSLMEYDLPGSADLKDAKLFNHKPRWDLPSKQKQNSLLVVSVAAAAEFNKIICQQRSQLFGCAPQIWIYQLLLEFE